MVYSEINDLVIIGYGLSHFKTILSDFWILNLKENKWIPININSNDISPRYGVKAVLINSEIWIFGGQNENNYFDDLHILNLQNGIIKRPITTGSQPSPKSNHIMSILNNDTILIYGGNDTNLLTELHLLDISTLNWTQININHSRTSCSFLNYHNKIFIYGSSKTPGLLCFDLDNLDGYIIPNSGIVPSSLLMNSSFLVVDDYFFLIGGNDNINNKSFSPIYVFDYDRKNWFIFDISPDCETTTLKDGEIDQNGHFLLPVCTHSSAIYKKYSREILVFLGDPQNEPPLLYSIQVSEPLSILHLQKDLLQFFK